MHKSSTRLAISRVKDRMREGASLMRMSSVHGMKWYVVPGREVDEEIALKIIREPDVFPSEDGLFPGISQTYKIGPIA
jgi:hypothetical protein